MPRNASGSYTLPSGNPVVSGTLIDATWANNTLADLGNEVTDSLSRSGEGAMLAPLRITDGVQATPSLAFSNEPSSGLYRAGSNEWWAVAAGVQNLRFTNTGLTTRAAAGAVGTPSIAAFNDVDTGIYFPGANELAIATGGAARMTFDSAGAVAVPGTFTLSGGTANGVLYLNGSKVATSGSALTFNGTTLVNTGPLKVGDGAASNTSRLMVNNATNTATGIQLFQDGIESWIMGMPANSAGLAWSASGAEKMRLTSSVLSTDSSINVGIGTTNTTNGRVNIQAGTAATGNSAFFQNLDGTNNPYLQIQHSANGTKLFGSSSAGGAASNLTLSTPGGDLLLDVLGNLGLGVTPSAWASGAKSLDVRSTSSYADVGGSTTIANNSYRDTAGIWTYKTTNFASRLETDTGAFRWFTAPSGTAGNAISFTQAMTLDASGNLGVGTTSPADTNSFGRALDIRSSTGAAAYFRDSDDATKYSVAGFFGADSNAYYGSWGTGTGVLFYSAGSERARITAGGYFKASNDGTYVSSTGTYHELRSTTNNSRTVSIHSAASNGTQYGLLISTANDQADATRYFLSCEGGGVERATIRSNGGLANYSANDVNLASDERLKKDISPLNTAWDKVKDIEVVNYRYKDCNEGDPLLYGVIAQQVQPIVPELVVVTREAKEATEDQEATPEFYGIREQPMYWLAIKALQEAMARIETLEAKVAALEAK
jgi:hypothetical protein